MSMRIFQGALIAAALATGGAVAAERVDAADPQSVQNMFFEMGFPARSGTDGVGDPVIEFMAEDGVGYVVFFYGCTNNADCTFLQFYRAYDTDGQVGLDTLNTLNAESRFVKFLLDGEDDVVVLLDVLTGEGGMAPADFAAVYDQLTRVVANFEDRVGWVPE